MQAVFARKFAFAFGFQRSGFGAARLHPGGFQALRFLLDAFALGAECCPAFVIDQTQLTAHFGQAQVGVIFTQH